jgi:hypothetical protein
MVCGRLRTGKLRAQRHLQLSGSIWFYGLSEIPCHVGSLVKKRKWMQSKAMHITSYNALHKLRDAILQVLPHELLTARALLWSVIAGRAVHKGATKPKSSAKQFCWPWWFWILPRLMSHSQYRQYPWKSHEVSLSPVPLANMLHGWCVLPWLLKSTDAIPHIPPRFAVTTPSHGTGGI